MRRKNEGAVVDQMGTHLLLLSFLKHNHSGSKRPTFASIDVGGTPYAHIRTAPAPPTVANRNRGARPPYRYVRGENNG